MTEPRALPGIEAPDVPLPEGAVRQILRIARTELAGRWRDLGAALAATLLAAGVSLLLPLQARHLVEDVFPARDLVRLAGALAGLLAIVAAGRGLSALKRFLLERLALRIVTARRERLFAHLLSLSPRALQATGGGTVYAGFTTDLTMFQDAMKTLFAVIVPSVLFVTIYVGAMIWYSWLLSLCLVLIVVPLVVATNVFGKRIHTAAHRVQGLFADLYSEIGETMGGAKDIKLLEMAPRVRARFAARNVETRAAAIRREQLMALHPLVMSLCVAVGVAALVFLGAGLLQGGMLDVGTLTSFVVCLTLAYPPIQELSNGLGQLAELRAAAERLDRLETLAPERDSAGPGRIPRAAPIRMEGVSFAYGDAPALHAVDLDIAAGERVAIVGPSGAGKSTLLELLPRFLEPTEGRILIAGQDTARMSLAALRRGIGLVLQVPFVFSGTLMENLAAADPDATPERIREVARQARVAEFAEALPRGYDTPIEAAGANLSVGQRQRIAIARVLLKDPPILLLDEPTSALDARSERLVGEALAQAARDRTVLIVAHRLSTVKDVDRVVVLSEGRVVEQGRHADLVAEDGLYAELCRQSDWIDRT